MMRSKLMVSAAALVVGTGVLIGSIAPASAQWRHRHAWGPAVIAGGIVGGAVAAATAPLWAPGYDGYDPNYRYGPSYAYGNGPYDYDNGPVVVERRSAAIDEPNDDSVAYCQAHFRSYDPSTGSYLGYDGMRHPCP
jgi:hypothetical protein